MSESTFNFFPKAASSCLLGNIHTHRKILSRNCWKSKSITWNFSGLFPSTEISRFFGHRGRVGFNGILFVSFKLTGLLLVLSLFLYKVIFPQKRLKCITLVSFYSSVLELDPICPVSKIQDSWTIHKYDTTACHILQVCIRVFLFPHSRSSQKAPLRDGAFYCLAWVPIVWSI